MQYILRLLTDPRHRGKALVANRGALLLLVPFIAWKVVHIDSRVKAVEMRLGITNTPVFFQVPFVDGKTNYYDEYLLLPAGNAFNL